MSYKRTDFLSTFEQMFASDQPARDMLHEEKQWKLFFPHEKSGPCYTYDPPLESDVGVGVGMYMTMKLDHWDPNLEIFLHEENEFYYTKNPKWDVYLDSTKLRKAKMRHPRASGKTFIDKILYCIMKNDTTFYFN